MKTEEQHLLLLEGAIAAINESILIADMAGIIVYVNPAFSLCTGYSADEAIGHSPALLNSGQHSPEFYKQFWSILQQGRSWSGRILNRKKDGTIFPSNLSVAPIFDRHGDIQHYVAVYEDLTDRENMQKQIIKAQKMEAVALMVGGIAHDFNNMLAGMIGNFYLMRQQHPEDEVLQQRIQSLEAATHHGANMIRQMLTFARKDITDMQILRLDYLIKENHRLTAAMVSEGIQLELAIEENELYIQGDATQLQQILFNLITNAHHAVQSRYKHDADPQQGHIRLQLSSDEPPDHLLREHPELLNDHGWGCIRCEDNGCGINAEDMDHVFDPFFTTKPPGEGSGLGMAMVYGAVQNHRGLIDIASKPDQGTCVRIWLPKHAAAVPVPNLRIAIEVDGNGHCVLLVDDEKPLRTALKEVLELHGFSVLTADNGEQAVDVFCAQQASIDAVVMDVIMPKKGGLLAAKEIRQYSTDVPIIFQTSYGEQALQSVSDNIPFSTSLQKPVHMPDLLQVIHGHIANRLEHHKRASEK
ncbi:MAG: ATP-binding protein [Mariprofundus sp.]|nr:ATP-binding protein [Mariprofundus sp.]